MSGNRSQQIEHSSLLEKVREQIYEAQEKKKVDVEKKLNEKIKKEKDAAQKKLDRIDQEIAEKEKALTSYGDFLSDLEADKRKIKDQVKEIMNAAAVAQEEARSIIIKVREEVKPVGELILQLKELEEAADQKVQSMKKELEQEFGVNVEVPKNGDDDNIGKRVEDDIDRLNRIEKLLESGIAKEKPIGTDDHENEGIKKEEKRKEDPAVNLVEGKKDGCIDSPISTLMEKLEKHRRYEGIKNKGRASYFETRKCKVLDGEFLISEVTSIIGEAEKFYNRHYDYESPKEQYFVKQKMINYQDDVRRLMLNVKKICDKNSCSFPKYTQDILNFKVFMGFFDRVTMENWSNDRDFSLFIESAKNLRDNFLGRLTPPNEYLHSIFEELEIEV